MHQKYKSQGHLKNMDFGWIIRLQRYCSPGKRNEYMCSSSLERASSVAIGHSLVGLGKQQGKF